jgi:hypothetical protein
MIATRVVSVEQERDVDSGVLPSVDGGTGRKASRSKVKPKSYAYATLHDLPMGTDVSGRASIQQQPGHVCARAHSARPLLLSLDRGDTPGPRVG